MSYQKLIEVAYQDWEENPDFAKACENVITKISSKEADAFRHLTFSSIKRLSESSLDINDIILLTQYLSGDRISLLTTGFEYIGQYGNFILDEENSYYAYYENSIAHPVTGEIIKDVKNDVFMFFTLNEGATK
ncbi:hypothetical protein GNP84_16360 [Aliivibrio fischeri]|uniref:hypothetical protein n=1 Tax=Aliivibrio fischeri TaxID=668 RepID=UPI0012D88C7E|nr:hypothetical protein [Aliivibrio fischeri]MUK78457.1 hypothetical protein [Aliivibrio fischeri]